MLYGGGAVLFIMDNFHPDIKFSSVTAVRERRTIRMGSYRGVISRASFRQLPRNRQIVLYFDVVTQKQPVCLRSVASGKKLLLAVRYCNAGRACGLGCWGLQRGRLAPPCAATIEDSPVLLKKHSPILTYQCHLAPHHCEDQVQFWVNGLMHVVLSSPRTPKMSGKYGYTVRTPSPYSALGLKEKRSKLPPQSVDASRSR